MVIRLFGIWWIERGLGFGMDHFLLAQVSVSRKMSQWSERLEDDDVGIDRWVIRLYGG